jgi:hypothetical protein
MDMPKVINVLTEQVEVISSASQWVGTVNEKNSQRIAIERGMTSQQVRMANKVTGPPGRNIRVVMAVMVYRKRQEMDMAGNWRSSGDGIDERRSTPSISSRCPTKDT